MPPPGGTGLSPRRAWTSPPQPAPPLPGQRIAVCSALSTSQGRPVWALPWALQKLLLTRSLFLGMGVPAPGDGLPGGSSCALSGRCLRCPGGTPLPGSSCGASVADFQESCLGGEYNFTR